MATTKFFIRKATKTAINDEYQIFFRISHGNSNPKEWSTGFKIKKDDWDKVNQQLKSKSKLPGRETINDTLLLWKNKAVAIILDLKVQYRGNGYPLSQIVDRFNNYLERRPVVQELSWDGLYDLFTNDLKRSDRTKITYKTTKAAVKEFIGDREWRMSYFSTSFFDEYIDYLLDKKEYEPSYVEKKYVQLRKFIKYVHKKHTEIDIDSHVLNYKPDRELIISQKPVIYLHPDEFEKIWNYTSKKQHLEHAKDLFIFMCLTGLRTSDKYIHKAEIHNGFIIKKNIKTRNTNNVAKIPITESIIYILQKYNYNLPRMADQKINEYIKDIGKELELTREVEVLSTKGGNPNFDYVPLWTKLSTKIGRKTYATHASQTGWSDQGVLNVLGNKKLDNLVPYIGTDDRYQLEMANKSAIKIPGIIHAD